MTVTLKIKEYSPIFNFSYKNSHPSLQSPWSPPCTSSKNITIILFMKEGIREIITCKSFQEITWCPNCSALSFISLALTANFMRACSSWSDPGGCLPVTYLIQQVNFKILRDTFYLLILLINIAPGKKEKMLLPIDPWHGSNSCHTKATRGQEPHKQERNCHHSRNNNWTEYDQQWSGYGHQNDRGSKGQTGEN